MERKETGQPRRVPCAQIRALPFMRLHLGFPLNTFSTSNLHDKKSPLLSAQFKDFHKCTQLYEHSHLRSHSRPKVSGTHVQPALTPT